jgi:hypothetical protein
VKAAFSFGTFGVAPGTPCVSAAGVRGRREDGGLVPGCRNQRSERRVLNDDERAELEMEVLCSLTREPMFSSVGDLAADHLGRDTPAKRREMGDFLSTLNARRGVLLLKTDDHQRVMAACVRDDCWNDNYESCRGYWAAIERPPARS